MSDQIFKFRNDLIEAYKGHYEEDRDVKNQYETEQRNANVGNKYPTWQDFDQWLTEWVQKEIVSNGPKQRLEIYLEWNGILGYTNSIMDIAMGKFSA